MLVGVDFDNTIVCCDDLFHRAAVERGLVPAETPADKGLVRDYLRRSGREEAWTELQGYVYGARLAEASAYPGALEFFTRAREIGLDTCVISHKTRRPFVGPPSDLHAAAHAWLESHGFYDQQRTGLSPVRVYLEPSKHDKIARIEALGCTHFIDDLPEFLTDPGFPQGVARILFDPAGSREPGFPYARMTCWAEAMTLITGERDLA